MERKFTMEKNFFLKQVDPVEVFKSYSTGELRLPADKIKFDNVTISPDMEIGKDYTSPIYEITDKNGDTIRVVTTDHDKWVANNGTVERGRVLTLGQIAENYVCHWCRLKYIGEHIILPIKIDRDLSTNKFIFYGTGSYCCFECAYADLKTKSHCCPYMRDSLYADGESLLRFMYKQYTGKDTLVAAPEWFLHEKNGGKLPDKDFFNSKSTYVECPNIIMNSVKVTYYQTNK